MHLDPAGLLPGDSEVRRVDEIIGGVDPKNGNRDATELRGGIVVSAGIKIIETVVCVDRVDRLSEILIGVALGLLPRRILFLQLQCGRRRDQEETAFGTKARYGLLLDPPPSHAGSFRMFSIAIERHIRLRPAIGTVRQAKDASASV